MTRSKPRRLELKFNSRVGALLCPTCQRIVATGFDHEGAQYECVHCGDTVKVGKDEDGSLVDTSDEPR
jgi:ribosomal protein S27E